MGHAHQQMRLIAVSAPEDGPSERTTHDEATPGALAVQCWVLEWTCRQGWANKRRRLRRQASRILHNGILTTSAP